MECQSAAYSECINCDKLRTCKLGQITILNKRQPERDPDAITSDFQYGRGEFDAFNVMTSREIRSLADKYNKKISEIRRSIGLE